MSNSYFTKFWNSEVISQHLLINLGLGPPLKCAPGHDSMEDSNIIKSYCPKSGVMDEQNLESGIWGICGWGASDKQSAFFPVLELPPKTLDSVQTFPGNVCTESPEIQVWD